MKKKIVFLVLGLFIFTRGALASNNFSDLNTSHSNYEAIESLISSEIIKGYPDGSFKPNKNISRAEFSSLLLRAKGWSLEDVQNFKSSNIFKDVNKNHWAAGYINLAYELKIISGIGDNTFKPDDNVTYEQAIKMIVIASLHSRGESEAIKRGGYPNGYISIGEEIGLNHKVNASLGIPATRDMVAQMIFNGNISSIGENINTSTSMIKDMKIGDHISSIKLNSYGSLPSQSGKWVFYNDYKDFTMLHFVNDKISYIYSMDTKNHKDASIYKDLNQVYAVEIGDIPNDNEAATERLVFEITNAFRALHNKEALKWNSILAKTAKDHSKDMFNRKFFSHVNPDGLSPADRVAKSGYKAFSSGENIDFNYANAVSAMDGWINSPGHRENILRDTFTDLGVGWYNSYGTQVFGGSK